MSNNPLIPPPLANKTTDIHRFRIPRHRSAILVAAVGLAVWQNRDAVRSLFQPGNLKAVAGTQLPSMAEFLNASTPEERARLVLGGQDKLDQLRARYQHGDPDQLQAADFLASGAGPADTPDRPGWATLTASRGRGLPEVFACFRRHADGTWLLDYDLYLQTLTDSVAAFASGTEAGEATLRVVLQRPVRGGEGAMPLVLTEPFNPRTALTIPEVRKDLADLLAEGMPPGTSRAATVLVAWVHPPDGGGLQPILRKHLCWGIEPPDAPPAQTAGPPQALLGLAAH